MRDQRTLDFLKKLKDNDVLDNNYDYSKTLYIDATTNITIFDENGFEHSQNPRAHLKGFKLSILSAVNKTQYFIDRLKRTGNFNPKYDYSKLIYVNSDTKLIIIDENGFEHAMIPNSVVNGNQLNIRSVVDKANFFIFKSKLIHGDKYDYSKVNFVDTTTKVKIICPAHGEFEQTPNGHMSGRNCNKCGDLMIGKKLNRGNEKFINEAKKIHGEKYDYSLVKYINNNKKVIIIDENGFKHSQRPAAHLEGRTLSIQSAMNKTEYFAAKAKLVHGDKYDYSLVNYINNSTEISILCSKHNEFKQTPAGHLTGAGCPKCSGQNKNTSDLISEFLKIHGKKYDYSLVEYINNKTKVKIICPTHGEFEQLPSNHKKGVNCPKCTGSFMDTQYFIEKANLVHDNKYNYSLVEYSGKEGKVKIICPEHGIFEQTSGSHLNGSGCQKCGKQFMDTEYFIEKAKLVHGDKYDYSDVIYVSAIKPVKLKCLENNHFFEQSPNSHLNGTGCPKCVGRNKTTEEFIEEAKQIHGNKYNYSLVDYLNTSENIRIICNTHGEFLQKPVHHLRGQGCPVCGNGFIKSFKISLINSLSQSDLFSMDPFEIYTIIGQGKLPIDFGVLANSDAGSEERLTTLQELKDKFSTEDNNENECIEEETITSECEEISVVDDIDTEVTNTKTQEETKPELPNVNILGDLHSLDNSIYATMDKEALESLIQYKLRKLWNNVLNDDITVDEIKSDTGGEYFTQIKNLFLEEYEEVIAYKPKPGYKFQYQPNLMQKLTVIRLLKNKSYGNWSGTGAGKTLSFIVASREIDSKLTVVIALNSTIEQTCKAIKSVYPNSQVFTEYTKGYVFDRTKHNYLVLNYEKFQQEYSEELFQDLTNNNQIDFVVIDEVHNAKQRQEDDESIRRGVLNRLLGRIRANNKDLYSLVMSATPVVNNLYEAKSLLQLLTGLDYNDIDTRRTLPNALKVFQQLILNGLRFIPKYDIEINELTGSNMSNLNIDGSHLLDAILDLPQGNYIAIEKLLLEDKLNAVKPYLKKGVIIYSYLTTGFIKPIEKFVKNAGFTVGTYTGEETSFIRQENLNKFLSGDIDVLIGSRPIGTGVDGLQSVCDRMIPVTLPWTDSEYTQLKGRIYRQGSLFGAVEIVIPQVRINLENDEFWSWDIQRLNVIKNKKTLADAAVDGIVPSRVLPRPETMFKKSQESLQKWKDRVNAGNLVEVKRNPLNIDLYPSISDEQQRQVRIQSELSEFNRRGKTTRSETMHKEFTKNPESWFRYHALRKERMSEWDEIPYEYIATKIKNKNRKVADFGCGENLFKNCIPNNEVISFDHVAIDSSVIACDMKDVSKWLTNESIDIAVFSLALWGVNYKDYIKEAYRVLSYDGKIYIAEPIKDYPDTESEKELINLITEVGFKIVGEIERRGRFIYITGTKE
jgi:superfamily II DNA or RNA helicase